MHEFICESYKMNYYILKKQKTQCVGGQFIFIDVEIVFFGLNTFCLTPSLPLSLSAINFSALLHHIM